MISHDDHGSNDQKYHSFPERSARTLIVTAPWCVVESTTRPPSAIVNTCPTYIVEGVCIEIDLHLVDTLFVIGVVNLNDRRVSGPVPCKGHDGMWRPREVVVL